MVKKRRAVKAAMSNEKFYTTAFPNVKVGEVKVAPQRGNYTVFIGLSDGTIAYQWCESKVKAMREAKYARDTVKRYGSDAPYWTAEGYKIYNPKANASTSIKRRSRVTAAERPITPADRKRCIDFVARDYGVTKKQAAEWVKEYSDDRIRTLLGIESDQAKKAFIYDSTMLKRNFTVKASASARRRAVMAASGERTWVHTELPRDMAEKFKIYLRDNGIYFEPSEAYNLIHFACKMNRDEMRAANDFIDSIDNGVSASAAPKRRFTVTASAVDDFRKTWTRDVFRKTIPKGSREITVTFKDGQTAKYTTQILNDMMGDPSVDHIIDTKTGELLYIADNGVNAACGGKKPVEAGYRQYEDPYKLEQMLEEAEARLAEDPDDVDLRIWVYELRDRINFAWQDDEYDAENADRFDDDVFGKSNVTCTEKTDTFVIYNHGNFVSSGGYDALRGGIYEIVSVDEDAKKACIDYCNSFGDPVIEETATANEVADTTTEVIAAEYSDAWDAEEFAVYIGDHHNGVNIEIFDKALAAVNAATDVEIEKAWSDFADVPMNPETEEIEQDFMHFPAGTNREEIWRWFDKNHSKGVAHLLYGAAVGASSSLNMDAFNHMPQYIKFYGYDVDGADVTTDSLDFPADEDDIKRVVFNLFDEYPEIDTVDTYIIVGDGNRFEQEHQSSTFTRDYIDKYRNSDFDIVESAKSVKCGYDLGADTADDTYTVDSFFGYNGDPFRGLADGITTDDWSEVESWSHEHLLKGENVKIDGPQGVLEITADEYNQAWEDGAADFDINEQIVDYKQRIVNSSTDITAASRSGEVDPEAVRELVLVITNDGDLYREHTTPMIENLKKKVAKGVYDREKAVKLWQYLADEGVRRYGKEYGPGYSVAWLSPATRRAIAEQLRDYYEEEIMWDVNHADDAKASTEITTL